MNDLHRGEIYYISRGGRHTVMSSRQTVRRSSSAMKRTMKTVEWSR